MAKKQLRDKVVGATEIKKGQYEKIKGTRIELSKAGVHVRVVVEDGKQFCASNPRAARQHLVMLARQAVEQAEIRARIDGKDPQVAAAREWEARTTTKNEDKGKKVKNKALKKPAAAQKPADDRAARWRQSVQEHVAKAVSQGRQVLSPEVSGQGVVLQRAKGFAWVQLQCADGIPNDVLSRIRSMNTESRGLAQANGAEPFCRGADGDIVRVDFADVAQEGLRLEAGVQLRFKLYTDKRGVGAYDVVAGDASEQDAPPQCASASAAGDDAPRAQEEPTDMKVAVDAATSAEQVVSQPAVPSVADVASEPICAEPLANEPAVVYGDDVAMEAERATAPVVEVATAAASAEQVVSQPAVPSVADVASEPICAEPLANEPAVADGVDVAMEPEGATLSAVEVATDAAASAEPVVSEPAVPNVADVASEPVCAEPLANEPAVVYGDDAAMETERATSSAVVVASDVATSAEQVVSEPAMTAAADVASQPVCAEAATEEPAVTDSVDVVMEPEEAVPSVVEVATDVGTSAEQVVSEPAVTTAADVASQPVCAEAAAEGPAVTDSADVAMEPGSANPSLAEAATDVATSAEQVVSEPAVTTAADVASQPIYAEPPASEPAVTDSADAAMEPELRPLSVVEEATDAALGSEVVADEPAEIPEATQGPDEATSSFQVTGDVDMKD